MTVINIFFKSFHNENVCCGYSLEMPHRGISNDSHSKHVMEIRGETTAYLEPLA